MSVSVFPVPLMELPSEYTEHAPLERYWPGVLNEIGPTICPTGLSHSPSRFSEGYTSILQPCKPPYMTPLSSENSTSSSLRAEYPSS